MEQTQTPALDYAANARLATLYAKIAEMQKEIDIIRTTGQVPKPTYDNKQRTQFQRSPYQPTAAMSIEHTSDFENDFPEALNHLCRAIEANALKPAISSGRALTTFKDPAYSRAFKDVNPSDNKPIEIKEVLSTLTAVKLLAYGTCFGAKIKEVIADDKVHPRSLLMAERFKEMARNHENEAVRKSFNDHLKIITV